MDKKVVAEILFTTSEANSLFYDSGAFGSARITNIKRLMPSWARKDRRKVNFSRVFYYVDRGPIISVSTTLITFEVFNGVSWRSPSPKAGIALNNEVRVCLRFKKPVVIAEAIRSAFDFCVFCEILSQTKQAIRNIQIRHRASTQREGLIDLFASF
jgi:hypothetical protein